MSIKPRRQVLNPDQMPLIVPDSDWSKPSELPDLRKIGTIALDTENKDDGLAQGRGPGWALGAGHVCGVGVAWRTGTEIQRIYVPVSHPDTDCFPREQVSRWLKDITKTNRVVFQNAPYDVGWMSTDLGVPVPGTIDDIGCQAVMINESHRPVQGFNKPYSLDAICHRLGVPLKDEALLREAANVYGIKDSEVKANLWRMPARYVGPYGQQDPASTLAAWELQQPELVEQNLEDAYRLEMDLIPMVHEMRRRGIRLDVEGAHRAAELLELRRDQKLKELRDRIKGPALSMNEIRNQKWIVQTFTNEGVEFNEKDGKASFEKDWMRQGYVGRYESGRQGHWLPQIIAEIKQCHDAADKFIRGFLIDYAHRGRIHASINQFKSEDGGTRTHRFSYSDPPLQQMPSRPEKFLEEWVLTGEIAKEIRGLFLPERGEKWFSPDYCHDAKTEILTEQGWVKFTELGSEKVAQWHQDSGLIDFVEPLSKYVGPERERMMTRVKSKRVDFMVTEDHRCLFQDPITEEYHVIRGGDVTHRVLRDMVVPQRTQLVDVCDAPVSDALIRLIVAMQADASDRLMWGSPTWNFKLRKERKQVRLRQLLGDLRISFRSTSNDTGWMGFQFDDRPEFREWLGHDKTFRMDVLLRLSQRQREIFLEELMLWDGSRSGTGGVYTSTNKQNVEVVAALATMSGRGSQMKKWKNRVGKKPCWSAHVMNREFKTRVRGGTSVMRRRYYGRVYCVTVPTGFIVTRRNGLVTVGGQSQQEYRLIVHYAAVLGCTKAEEAVEKYRRDPNTDFHNLVVEMTGLSRRHAKDVNFAKAYGAGVKKFALMTGMSLEDAESTMGQYDGEMPFVKQLMQRCERAAQKRGYIVMIDGARMHFNFWEPAWLSREERQRGWNDGWEMGECDHETAKRRVAGDVPRPYRAGLNDEHPWRKKTLKRAFTHKAGNALIQGSAARQGKRAMRDMWREGYCPLMQMHDEFPVSVAKEKDGQRIADIMREAIPLRVPMRVDEEFGATWGDAKHTFKKAKRAT